MVGNSLLIIELANCQITILADRTWLGSKGLQEMAYGVSNGHVTYDVTWPQRCYDCKAVRSAILTTAWLLVKEVAVTILEALIKSETWARQLVTGLWDASHPSCCIIY